MRLFPLLLKLKQSRDSRKIWTPTRILVTPGSAGSNQEIVERGHHRRGSQVRDAVDRSNQEIVESVGYFEQLPASTRLHRSNQEIVESWERRPARGTLSARSRSNQEIVERS